MVRANASSAWSEPSLQHKHKHSTVAIYQHEHDESMASSAWSEPSLQHKHEQFSVAHSALSSPIAAKTNDREMIKPLFLCALISTMSDATRKGSGGKTCEHRGPSKPSKWASVLEEKMEASNFNDEKKARGFSLRTAFQGIALSKTWR